MKVNRALIACLLFGLSGIAAPAFADPLVCIADNVTINKVVHWDDGYTFIYTDTNFIACGCGVSNASRVAITPGNTEREKFLRTMALAAVSAGSLVRIHGTDATCAHGNTATVLRFEVYSN